jgi:hypothetical protein
VYSNSSEVRLYLSNFRRLDMGFIPAANITVQLHGLSSSASTASVIRLDNDHLTAVEVWQTAGRRRLVFRDLTVVRTRIMTLRFHFSNPQGAQITPRMT